MRKAAGRNNKPGFALLGSLVDTWRAELGVARDRGGTLPLLLGALSVKVKYLGVLMISLVGRQN